MVINRCWRCMEDMGSSHICPQCGFDNAKEKTLTYALKPNTILHGKYLVGKVLGQGGFGITYIGFDLTLELKVAIKEYFPFKQASRNTNKSCCLSWQDSQSQTNMWKAGCRRFLSEARKMAKINSIPEIVSVRDTFEENQTAYIVMDYVPGMTLKEHVRKQGTFSYEQCMDLLLPLVEGLDKVHRQGIIHRDISPANLMLSPQGKVYLLDLGAAKDLKNSSGTSEAVATQGYSPMEQYANSGQAGPWSDVYSMTASIYYCLFGKTPPSAVDRVERDILDLSEKTRYPLTAKQIAVLKKGLAVHREQRYQSAQELLQALMGARRKKNSAGKIIAGAVAGLAVAAAAALLLIQKPWLPSVEQCGVESPFLDKNLVEVEEKYEYFTDLEGSLVQVVYDEEKQVFYVDSGEVIFAQDENIEGDSVGGLMLSDEYLYFTYFGGKDRSDYLMRMNLDGTEPTQLLELTEDHTQLQYVKLSDGEEYFYYLKDSGEDEEDYHLYIYRYHVQKGVEEKLIDEEADWYSVLGKYLYYATWDADEKSGTLKRANLDGKKPKVLDEEHNFVDGFVQEDALYLLQRTNVSGDFSVGLVKVNAKGQPVEEGRGVFSVDWAESEWTVGGGWLFYWQKGTDELHRIRLDGTADEVLFSGQAFGELSYYDGDLYFQDGYFEEDGSFYGTEAYIADSYGDFNVSCGMERPARSVVKTTPEGVEYQIENEEVKLLGYVGTERDVIMPDTIEGYPVNDKVNWDTFHFGALSRAEVRFYKLLDLSELTYTTSTDGISITAYSGNVTGTGYDNVAIPGTINGKPVVELGDKVFQGRDFAAIYLPEQLKIIGSETFDACKNLQHVVFPDTLVDIGNYAFYGCSLDGEEIVLPEGLTDMGMGVFYYCTPKSVYLPSTLSSVGDGFMAGCGGEYIVSPEHELIRSTDGIIISQNGTVFYAFPYDRTGTYTLPKTVTKIFGGAFYGCQLSKVIVPENVTIIADRAFLHCADMTSIVLPRGLKEIGSRAFVYTGLKEITIPYSCKVAADSFDENLTVKYFP